VRGVSPDSKLKVLHLCSGPLFGGIERFLVTLAESTAMHQRARQMFLLCSHGRFESELRTRQAAVEHLGDVRLRHPLAVQKARKQARKLILEFCPDVVLAHDTWPLVVLGPAASGYPLVFYQHNRVGGSLLERFIPRQLVRGVFCTSAFVAESTASLFPGVATSVVRCMVPAPPRHDRSRIREKLGLAPDDVAIIQVSRFEAYKGHLLLAAALKRLQTRAPWRALIVGGASRRSERALRAELEPHLVELGGRLQLLGERSDVPELLQACDVFCQPNTGPEPFGLVFVEAMFAGLPVVTTDMGGAREAIDNAVGVLVPPDPAAVTQALAQLVDNPETRRRLGSNGPARAKAICGEETTVETLVNSLEAVISTAESHLPPDA
jgi:glycosyltransferase involved in cell wall biosynthesis